MSVAAESKYNLRALGAYLGNVGLVGENMCRASRVREFTFDL